MDFDFERGILTYLGQVVAKLVDDLSTMSIVSSQIRVDFSWPAQINVMDWLDAQSLFPQFYWQTRDSDEEVIALGQIKTFTCPFEAQNALVDDQRIWGGVAFDPHTQESEKRCPSSYFFLPQFELTRSGEKWSFVVNVGEVANVGESANDHSTNQPRDENVYNQILHALSQLNFSTIPLSDLGCRILSIAHQPRYSHWENMVEHALEDIERTELKKVVLARKTTIGLDCAISGVQLLKASLELNTRNFHFLFAMDEKRTFLGSTPERLFFRRKRAILTEALAGTIGRGQCANEDMKLAQWLLNDEKNVYENKLVVDDISDRLMDYCSALEIEEKPHLVRLRKVQHLKREIKAKLHPLISSARLLHSLHPTAAIAGLPRKLALSFIAKQEPFDRGWYSGSVGYLSQKSSEFCVAIRSALVMDEMVHLYAGAGIVPGSFAEHEWKELDRKIATLMSLLTPQRDGLKMSRMEKKAG